MRHLPRAIALGDAIREITEGADIARQPRVLVVLHLLDKEIDRFGSSKPQAAVTGMRRSHEAQTVKKAATAIRRPFSRRARVTKRGGDIGKVNSLAWERAKPRSRWLLQV